MEEKTTIAERQNAYNAGWAAYEQDSTKNPYDAGDSRREFVLWESFEDGWTAAEEFYESE